MARPDDKQASELADRKAALDLVERRAWVALGVFENVVAAWSPDPARARKYEAQCAFATEIARVMKERAVFRKSDLSKEGQEGLLDLFGPSYQIDDTSAFAGRVVVEIEGRQNDKPSSVVVEASLTSSAEEIRSDLAAHPIEALPPVKATTTVAPPHLTIVEYGSVRGQPIRSLSVARRALEEVEKWEKARCARFATLRRTIETPVLKRLGLDTIEFGDDGAIRGGAAGEDYARLAKSITSDRKAWTSLSGPLMADVDLCRVLVMIQCQLRGPNGAQYSISMQVSGRGY